MKVLILIPCLMTGGTEIQTLNLVRALVQGGHQVVTLCYFEHCPEMVIRFQEAGSEVVCLSKEGIRINGWRGIIFLYRGIRKVLKHYRPDVAHVQYMAPGAIPILLLRLMGMTRIIATAHTAADIYPNLWLVHFVQRYCVRAFTCITLRAEQSFFGSAQLYDEQTILRKRNHFTIYNALPSQFSSITVERKHHVPLNIGVVSRLETIKGMDLVVPAFAKLCARYPDIRLWVVGDGSLREQMQQQAEEMQCKENIVWAGRQPQESLPDYYRKMDIVWMPSRSEGFGLTAIEAMACGCVVVAARVGGLPEVVKEGEIGLLHEPESVDDLARQTHNLIEHPMVWAQYSKQASQYVKRYSFERYASLFTNLYQKIVF